MYVSFVKYSNDSARFRVSATGIGSRSESLVFSRYDWLSSVKKTTWLTLSCPVVTRIILCFVGIYYSLRDLARAVTYLFTIHVVYLKFPVVCVKWIFTLYLSIYIIYCFLFSSIT